MTMNRVRCTWAGFSGAPGLTTFYLANEVTNVAPIKAFFDGVSFVLPTVVSITIPSAGDQINETDGEITGVWAGSGGGTTAGAGGGGVYSGPTGACVNWLTSLIVAGRRPMGRTFLVPLIGSAYEANGTLSAGAVSSIQTAATALVVALGGGMKIFSRPFVPEPGQPGTPRVGAAATVIAARVPDKAIVLRSRRD